MAANLTVFPLDFDNSRALATINKTASHAQRSFASIKGGSNAFDSLTKGANDFNKTLNFTNARILAFAAETTILYGVANAFKAIFTNAFKVEQAMAEIQVNVKATESDLRALSSSLFEIASETGQAFGVAAEAAAEFGRQGLKMNQTLSATKAALVLTQITGMKATDSVQTLTAAFNTFGKQGEDYESIVNKMAAADTSFAVSSKDLSEAIRRVGSTAIDAKVSYEELLALVTSVQQKTARGGSVIGNSLKTIFTRLQRGSNATKLENLGIQTRNQDGEFLNQIEVLRSLSEAYKDMSDSQKASVSEMVGGVYQINIVKALFEDLGKEAGVYSSALDIVKRSQNDAFLKSQFLASTTTSKINEAKNALIEFGGILGTMGVNEASKNIILTFSQDIVGWVNDGLKKNAEDSNVGEKIGQSLIKGIISAISGPGTVIILRALGQLGGKVLGGFSSNVVGTFVGGRASELKARASSIIQENTLRIKSIDNERRVNDEIAKGNMALLNRGRIISGIMAAQTGLGATAPLGGTASARPVRRTFAQGYNPVFSEATQIAAGVGGATKRARPVETRINTTPGRGENVVVNTDEYIVKNYMNTGADAVFNKHMIKGVGGVGKLKELGDVKKVYAGGYQPNFARGFKPKPSRGTLIGSGVEGSYFQLRGDIGKKVINDYNSKDSYSRGELRAEYAATRLLNENRIIPGVTAPRVFGNLKNSLERGRIGKEYIKDPLATDALGGSERSKIVGRSMARLFTSAGFQAVDLHGKNFTLNKQAKDFLSSPRVFRSLQRRLDAVGEITSSEKRKKSYRMLSSVFQRMEKRGGKINIIDSGFFSGISADAKKSLGKYESYARGFTPKPSRGKLIGSGVDGDFHQLRGNVGVKSFRNFDPKNPVTKKFITEEFAATRLLNENRVIPGVTAPRVFGNLKNSLERGRIGKEVIGDPTASKGLNIVGGSRPDDVGGAMKRIFGVFGYKADDLHSRNFTVNEKAKEFFARPRITKILKKRVREFDNSPPWERKKRVTRLASMFNRMERVGGKINVIDAGEFSGQSPRAKGSLERYSNFARGFMPSFASSRSIAEKSGSDLSFKGGKLKVDMLNSYNGNPLFEIMRLVKAKELKSIDAGSIVGPRIPENITTLGKTLNRIRSKGVDYPRVSISGKFNPRYLAKKINFKSEKKVRQQFGQSFDPMVKAGHLRAGDDFFTRKDMRGMASSFKSLGVKSRDDSFVDLGKILPKGLASGYIPNSAKGPQDKFEKMGVRELAKYLKGGVADQREKAFDPLKLKQSKDSQSSDRQKALRVLKKKGFLDKPTSISSGVPIKYLSDKALIENAKNPGNFNRSLMKDSLSRGVFNNPKNLRGVPMENLPKQVIRKIARNEGGVFSKQRVDTATKIRRESFQSKFDKRPGTPGFIKAKVASSRLSTPPSLLQAPSIGSIPKPSPAAAPSRGRSSSPQKKPVSPSVTYRGRSSYATAMGHATPKIGLPGMKQQANVRNARLKANLNNPTATQSMGGGRTAKKAPLPPLPPAPPIPPTSQQRQLSTSSAFQDYVRSNPFASKKDLTTAASAASRTNGGAIDTKDFKRAIKDTKGARNQRFAGKTSMWAFGGSIAGSMVGDSTGNEDAGKAVGDIATGVALGASFGPKGAIIGAAIGGFNALATAVKKSMVPLAGFEKAINQAGTEIEKQQNAFQNFFSSDAAVKEAVRNPNSSLADVRSAVKQRSSALADIKPDIREALMKASSEEEKARIVSDATLKSSNEGNFVTSLGILVKKIDESNSKWGVISRWDPITGMKGSLKLNDSTELRSSVGSSVNSVDFDRLKEISATNNSAKKALEAFESKDFEGFIKNAAKAGSLSPEGKKALDQLDFDDLGKEAKNLISEIFSSAVDDKKSIDKATAEDISIERSKKFLAANLELFSKSVKRSSEVQNAYANTINAVSSNRLSIISQDPTASTGLRNSIQVVQGLNQNKFEDEAFKISLKSELSEVFSKANDKIGKGRIEKDAGIGFIPEALDLLKDSNNPTEALDKIIEGFGKIESMDPAITDNLSSLKDSSRFQEMELQKQNTILLDNYRALVKIERKQKFDELIRAALANNSMDRAFDEMNFQDLSRDIFNPSRDTKKSLESEVATARRSKKPEPLISIISERGEKSRELLELDAKKKERGEKGLDSKQIATLTRNALQASSLESFAIQADSFSSSSNNAFAKNAAKAAKFNFANGGGSLESRKGVADGLERAASQFNGQSEEAIGLRGLAQTIKDEIFAEVSSSSAFTSLNEIIAKQIAGTDNKGAQRVLLGAQEKIGRGDFAGARSDLVTIDDYRGLSKEDGLAGKLDQALNLKDLDNVRLRDFNDNAKTKTGEVDTSPLTAALPPALTGAMDGLKTEIEKLTAAIEKQYKAALLSADISLVKSKQTSLLEEQKTLQTQMTPAASPISEADNKAGGLMSRVLTMNARRSESPRNGGPGLTDSLQAGKDLTTLLKNKGGGIGEDGRPVLWRGEEAERKMFEDGMGSGRASGALTTADLSKLGELRDFRAKAAEKIPEFDAMREQFERNNEAMKSLSESLKNLENMIPKEKGDETDTTTSSNSSPSDSNVTVSLNLTGFGEESVRELTEGLKSALEQQIIANYKNQQQNPRLYDANAGGLRMA